LKSNTYAIIVQVAQQKGATYQHIKHTSKAWGGTNKLGYKHGLQNTHENKILWLVVHETGAF